MFAARPSPIWNQGSCRDAENYTETSYRLYISETPALT